MTDGPVSEAAMDAATTADYAWMRSPLRERGGSWGGVGAAQLRRLLEGAAPVIRAEDRAILRQQAKVWSVLAWVNAPSRRPGDVLGVTAVNVVTLETLNDLLDADHPEDPVPDLNTGRDGYPPRQSYTVITGSGPLTFDATSCREDDEWLILDNAGTTAGKFRLSEIGGYYQNATGSVVAEGAA